MSNRKQSTKQVPSRSSSPAQFNPVPSAVNNWTSPDQHLPNISNHGARPPSLPSVGTLSVAKIMASTISKEIKTGTENRVAPDLPRVSSSKSLAQQTPQRRASPAPLSISHSTSSPIYSPYSPSNSSSSASSPASGASPGSSTSTPNKQTQFLFRVLMDRNVQASRSPSTAKEKKAISRVVHSAIALTKIERLSAFKDVLSVDRHALFQKKLRQCFVVLNYEDPRADIKEKMIKSQIFSDLMEYLSESTPPFPETAYQVVAQMVSLNVFRPLQPLNQIERETSEVQEDIPQFDIAWPQLHAAYTLFINFLDHPQFDPEVGKKPYDGTFASQFIELFQSRDPRERDFVKKIVHKLYAKFFATRQPIRKSISYLILQYSYERSPIPGMIEMLEILGSIINGLSVPLKEEHTIFFERVLLTLLRPSSYVLYASQLHTCIKNYISKDYSLIQVLIFNMLQFWPVTHSLKEIKFIELIQELLQKCEAQQFGQFVTPLFKRIGLCLESRNFVIAERALFLWADEAFLALVSVYRSTILPLIFKPLMNNLKEHWDSYIRNHSSNVFAIFIASDIGLFRTCHAAYVQNLEREPLKEERRVRMWRKVDGMCMGNAETQAQFLKLSTSLPEIRSPPSRKVKLRAEFDDVTQLIKKVMGTALEPAREKRDRSPVPLHPQTLQKAKSLATD